MIPSRCLLAAIWPLAGLVAGSLVNWARDHLSYSDAPLPFTTLAFTPRFRLAVARLLMRPRYPRWLWLWPDGLVELLTAGLFAVLGWRFGLTMHALATAAGCAFFLLVASVDLKVRRVPDRLVYPAAAGVMILRAIPPGQRTLGALLGACVAALPFLLVALARPGTIGGGDVKLAVLIGLIFGFPQTVWPIGLGILAGGLTALVLALGRHWDLKRTMPYAPFLCLGAIASLLYTGIS